MTHKLNHTQAYIDNEPKFHVNRRVEIPDYLLPDDLQELHRDIGAKRHELRKLENEFRNRLHMLLSQKLS